MKVGFLCNKVIRLLKGIVLLWMSSQFHLYCSVHCQLPLPTTQKEMHELLQLPDITCNKKTTRDTECVRRSSRGGRGKNRKRNSDDSTHRPNKRCRCRGRNRNRDNQRPERAMLDDHSAILGGSNVYPIPRPRIKICSDSKCLTFTNGRKTFNAPEYHIVSESTYLEVIEGAWELCGVFQDSISCVIMGNENYIDLFEGESVRVTTFRKLDLPSEISTPSSSDDSQRSEGDTVKNLVDQMSDMTKELAELADNIYAMEDSIERSNKLLLLDRYKSVRMRKKFLRVLDKLGDT